MNPIPAGAIALPETEERVFLGAIKGAHNLIHTQSVEGIQTCGPERVILKEIAHQYIDRLVNKYGLWVISHPECRDQEKKKFAVQYLKKCFTDLHNNPPILAIDFYRQMILIGWRWKFTLLSLCHVTVIQGNFSLTSSDFKVLVGNQELYKQANRVVNCLDWAMYQQHVEPIFGCITDLNINGWNQQLQSNPQQFFTTVGFTEAVQPRPGDLIVFYSARNGYVEHFGVLAEDMQVYSKWGGTQLYKHPINSVPNYYGDCYFLLRKEWPSQTLQRWVETKKVIPLPLTAAGGRAYLLNQINSLLSHANVLERSIFGRSYHAKLKVHLATEVQKITHEGNAEKQVLDIALHANSSVLPDFEIIHRG